jgi:hypothetical protein
LTALKYPRCVKFSYVRKVGSGLATRSKISSECIRLHSPNNFVVNGNPSRKGGDNPGAEEGAGGGQQAAEDLQAVLRIRINFIRIRVRIQHFRLNTDPDPIRIQGFNDKKLEKFLTI